jgi:hypothetical protein
LTTDSLSLFSGLGYFEIVDRNLRHSRNVNHPPIITMLRLRAMPSSLISSIISLLLLTSFTSAQTGTILDHARLPDCAFQCPILLGAQSLCVPPSAPQADQGSYQTCFCNSNYLAVFRVGGTAGVCDVTCQPNEIVQIQQWFQGLCTGGVVVIPNGGDAAAAPTTTVGSGSSSTAKPSSSGSNRSNRGPTWYAIFIHDVHRIYTNFHA